MIYKTSVRIHLQNGVSNLTGTILYTKDFIQHTMIYIYIYIRNINIRKRNKNDFIIFDNDAVVHYNMVQYYNIRLEKKEHYKYMIFFFFRFLPKI